MRRDDSICEWANARVAGSLAELRAVLERQDVERVIQAAARLEFTRARVLAAGLDESLAVECSTALLEALKLLRTRLLAAGDGQEGASPAAREARRKAP